MKKRRSPEEMHLSPLRRRWIAIGLLLLAPLAGCAPDPNAGLPRTLPPVEVYFSPHGGCTEAVVREIQAARSKILVQAYSFTSAPIAKALVEAHRRGVDVEVVLDRSQATEKYSSATFLLHAGIPVRIDAKHAIAHNKVMVFDDAAVLTGSFNFTDQAEKHNAENLLVLRDPQLARKYTVNWQEHWSHSLDYTGPKSEPRELTTPRRREKAGRS